MFSANITKYDLDAEAIEISPAVARQTIDAVSVFDAWKEALTDAGQHMVVIPKHGHHQWTVFNRLHMPGLHCDTERAQRVWRHPLFMGWCDFAGLIRINLQIQTCAPARGFDCPSNTSLG